MVFVTSLESSRDVEPTRTGLKGRAIVRSSDRPNERTNDGRKKKKKKTLINVFLYGDKDWRSKLLCAVLLSSSFAVCAFLRERERGDVMCWPCAHGARVEWREARQGRREGGREGGGSSLSDSASVASRTRSVSDARPVCLSYTSRHSVSPTCTRIASHDHLLDEIEIM